MPGSNDNQASAPNKTLMDQERAAAILSANAKKDGGGDGFGKRAQSAGDKNAAAVAASAANSPQKK